MKLVRLAQYFVLSTQYLRGYLFAFATLAAVVLSLESGPAKAQTRPPNVILIMADDLGRGHCGCYGQTKIRTPHIDSLAAQGMKFNQFYAGANVCAPSR